MSTPNPFQSPHEAAAPPPAKPETPAWGWVFFAACLGILVLTRGGAVWGAAGGAVGGVCLKVSQSRQLPLAAKLAICSALTAGLWALIWLLVRS